MGLEKIKILEEVASLEQLSELLAQLQRTMKYLLNGNLSFENIRVGGIIAETIDVNQLSAISADLGEIIAGIIRGIEIYGSKIATRETGYPRVTLSDTTDSILIEFSPTRRITIDANDYLDDQRPHLTWHTDGVEVDISLTSNAGFIIDSEDTRFTGDVSLQNNREIWLANEYKLVLGNVSLKELLDDYVSYFTYQSKINSIESRLSALETP